MDKDKVISEIINNDPHGILDIKPKASSVKSADERLIASFNEINDFYENNTKEPEPSVSNISEYQLYSRLKSIREDENKVLSLKSYDKHNLLNIQRAELNSMDDILDSDSLGTLNDDTEGLFEFKHTPKDYDRAAADFVAKRKPCKDFDKYEQEFKAVQKDLSNSKRKLVQFKQANLQPGDYYVHNGVLLYLESVDYQEDIQDFNSGSRSRIDGRTRCIFENGTESNMLYRSLYKALLVNGKTVTKSSDQTDAEIQKSFSNITDEDKEAGYIYVVISKSSDERISTIENLYKIGYSTDDPEERIKNAEQEPTYLMAPVTIVTAFQCFNMNPQKLEQLLHNFFGNSCLNIDVYDNDGKRHTPREWFIVPIETIEESIMLIITGDIINYQYDFDEQTILKI
ncbi:GIY-YIG nuclease family protein [Candidatus Pacearchaeota archaeon]|nr:GIY-YIG nuclease family protein [Candidatus Pacearchaeota archaeon]